VIKIIASTLLRFLEARGYVLASHEQVERHLTAEQRDAVIADLAEHIDRHLKLARGTQLEHLVAAINHLTAAEQMATDVTTRARIRVLCEQANKLLSSKRPALETFS